jgi:HEPN domain-containing protein
MQHNSGGAKDPQRWMQNARADLAFAGVPLPLGGMYEQLCFHAQQAAEKSIKAVLLHLGIEFPFTHNLQMLLDLLPDHISITTEVGNAIELNAYAVLTRYPGELEPVSISDYERALSIARATVEWAEILLKAMLCKEQ